MNLFAQFHSFYNFGTDNICIVAVSCQHYTKFNLKMLHYCQRHLIRENLVFHVVGYLYTFFFVTSSTRFSLRPRNFGLMSLIVFEKIGNNSKVRINAPCTGAFIRRCSNFLQVHNFSCYLIGNTTITTGILVLLDSTHKYNCITLVSVLSIK